MGIGNIFNREKKKNERQIQRLKDFASEFSENLKTVKSIEGFEEFKGFEELFDYLKNRSDSLFVMPGDDLMKYLCSNSANSQEADYINNKYPKEKLEEFNRVILFTCVLGLYLMRVYERLPLKTQIKTIKAMIKYGDIIDDVIALAYDFPEIDENKFLPLEDLFRRLVETKNFVGIMLFFLLGQKDENNKRAYSLKAHYKLLSAIRKNDFKKFAEVIEQSDERLADSLSITYANIYPFAVAMESYFSNEISLDDIQEYLSPTGFEFITSNSPASKIFGHFIGLVYLYLEYLWGELPNEAKGIDHFFEINGLSNFMNLYEEWCYQETEQLIDARKEANNKEQATNPSTESNDTNKEEGSSLDTNTDAEQRVNYQSPTSGDGGKTRKKIINYHIFVDEKPEVIEMLVKGLVEGYTTENLGGIPSLVSTQRSNEFYDEMERKLAFFFTGDRENYNIETPYSLIWKGNTFYLYVLMQLIFNKKELLEADKIIKKSDDPKDDLISKEHVKADFRGKNLWKEIEAVFGINPNSIKNSEPTIGKALEDTKLMVIKIAQFWLDCKKAGKN